MASRSSVRSRSTGGAKGHGVDQGIGRCHLPGARAPRPEDSPRAKDRSRWGVVRGGLRADGHRTPPCESGSRRSNDPGTPSAPTGFVTAAGIRDTISNQTAVAVIRHREPSLMESIKELADDIYRERVLRARRTPIEQKFLAGP